MSVEANGVEILAEIKSEKVETPVGELEVKLSVPAGKPAAVALMIHGVVDKDEIRWEWGAFVEKLRERKVACICPNLHSCDRTFPRLDAGPEDALEALKALIPWAYEKLELESTSEVPFLVYGKSWGGARALELCFSLTDDKQPLAGLVLACPAKCYREDWAECVSRLTVPVLLVWSKDDQVLDFKEGSEPLLAALNSRKGAGTLFAPAEEGGHRIDKIAAANEGIARKIIEFADLIGPL
eukprot:CAMPEP_0206495152 /NCGR_PEP_ID=MMETSP0324_2-20121206/48269_1 /ASSEMBLY_ACC=CAM_ASM_000836 /TAXON_ID=2866 /ORGANISM="Crypthecodinium cohnii, Strain Seligo" /LENGTH=239 /DNA_ID=CAMNT_0053979175 /DNA_START=161 /DNA_END=876 /DNA_ORIENTATION=-